MLNFSLKELEDKILPEDVLRAAHGGVIESIFYRDTDFPGENSRQMQVMFRILDGAISVFGNSKE